MKNQPTVGFYIPNLLGEYYESQWMILNQAAIERGINLIIFTPLMFLTDTREQRIRSRIFEFGTGERLDGLIISTASFLGYYTYKQITGIFKKNRGLPLVSIGEELPEAISILIDNKEGMRKLVQHFIQEHGYTKIAFIRGTIGNKEADHRFDAYKEVLSEYDIPYNAKLVTQGDFCAPSGKKAVEELLDIRGERPQAIIAANDDMILGAYTELQRRGIPIPDQIALGGFDNIAPISELPCPVTTVFQPFNDQMIAALEAVLKKINGEHVDKKILLPAEPVIRNSCGCRGDTIKNQAEQRELKKIVEDQEKYDNTQAGYSVGLLTDFYTYIINSNDMDVIRNQCEKLFIQVGVESCNLALYNKGLPMFLKYDLIPPTFSDTYMLFQDRRRIPEFEGRYRFRTTELYSDIMVNNRRRHTFIFSELIYQDEYYGFFMLEMNKINALVLNLFKVQFSNSLHNIYTRHQIESAYKELEEAKVAAESANKVKSRFLANMSHEIRTPMNAILGFINILIEQEKDSIKLDYMSIINDSARNLLHLINDILDLSKIEANHVELVNRVINLPQLFSSLESLFEIQAKTKGIYLIFDVGQDVPGFVIGDEVRIRQILTNVIGNGIKFTSEGGVRVRAKYSHEFLTVDIIDTGIGVPEEKIHEIFSPFKQQDSSIEREYGGTGLGLAISRSFAELMGGSLTAKSCPGTGTCFTLSLPLFESRNPVEEAHNINSLTIEPLDSPLLIAEWMQQNSDSPLIQAILKQALYTLPEKIASLQEAVITNRKSDVQFISHELKGMTGNLGMTELFVRTSEINEESKSESPRFNKLYRLCRELSEFARNIPQEYLAKTEAQELTLPVPTKDFPILVAEDNGISRKLIALYLRELSIIPQFAENGLEVLELLEKTKFQLLIMDIKMPKMDGVEALNAIRKNPAHKDLYVIALTANAVKGEASKYLSLGFNDYISKPVDKERFLSRIRQQLLKSFRKPPKLQFETAQEIWHPGAADTKILREIITELIESAQLFNPREAKKILSKLKTYRAFPLMDTIYMKVEKAIAEFNSQILGQAAGEIRQVIDRPSPEEEEQSHEE